MAINRTGLPLAGGPFTYISGGPPIALNNEIRGGVHRNSGAIDDQLCLLYTSPSPRDS